MVSETKEHKADGEIICMHCLAPPTVKELKQFPCKHLACQPCIDIELDSTKVKNEFQCSYCSESIRVPPGGFETYVPKVDTPPPPPPVVQPPPPPVVQPPPPPPIIQQPMPAPPAPVQPEAWEFPLVSPEQPIRALSDEEVEEMCHTLVDDDERCDFECHSACRKCGSEFYSNMTDPLIESCSADDEETACFGCTPSALLLPFRVLVIMKTIIPCCKVFRDENTAINEEQVYKELRRASKKAVLAKQLPLFPFLFTIVWSFVMLASMSAGVIWPFFATYSDITAIHSIAVPVINGGFLILWIVFIVLNLKKYRRKIGRVADVTAVKLTGNSLSYFSMEQLQMFFSELSLYPQICFAAVYINEAPMMVVPFSIHVILLLVVFALRVYAVVKIQRYIMIYYTRFLVWVIGNFCSVIFLIIIIAITSVQSYQSLQITAFVMVMLTTAMNVSIFFPCHLYEITMQAGINTAMLGTFEPGDIKYVMARLKNRETFYKNMYTMADAGWGSLTFFWMFPSIALVGVALFSSVDAIFFTVLAWFAFNAVVNYKTLLMFSASCCTILGVIGIIAFAFSLSFLLASIIYGFIFVVIALIIAVVCCAAMSEKRGRREVVVITTYD